MSSEQVPWCTVAIEESTCAALAELAGPGQPYNEVIKMLVAEHRAAAERGGSDVPGSVPQ